MTTFSIRASITAPGNYDRTTIAAGKRDAYTVSRGCLRQAGEGADAVGFRSRGIVLQVDPSPRLRLGTFNGRRPTRESLVGNGASAPPVSRFLYRPHYRRIKSESQDLSCALPLSPPEATLRTDFTIWPSRRNPSCPPRKNSISIGFTKANTQLRVSPCSLKLARRSISLSRARARREAKSFRPKSARFT